MRRFFLLLGLLGACAPFGTDDTVPNASDMTETPPAKKKSPAAPSTPDSPTTSTSPAMPAPVPPVDVCAGATFCEDFEKSDQGNGLWEDWSAINGDTFARSAPSAGAGAFSLGVKVLAGSQTKHSALRRNIGDFGHVEMTFQAQIPTTFGPNGHTNLVHLDFGSNGEFVTTIVGEMNQIGLVIKDDQRDYMLINKVEVTPNTWHKVRLVVDLPGNPPTAHMDIDGTDAVTRDELSVGFDGPPPMRITLGPDYKTTQDPFDFRIDDLRIDARD